jgi:hypothetical protein
MVEICDIGQGKIYGYATRDINMTEASNAPQCSQSAQSLDCSAKINVNASKGKNKSDDKDIAHDLYIKSLNAQEEAIRRGKQLYEEKRKWQRQRVEAQDGPNLQYLRLFDSKESTIELQAILLGKLAAEENSLKGLGASSCSSIPDFNKRVTEVEEAIRALQH